MRANDDSWSHCMMACDVSAPGFSYQQGSRARRNQLRVRTSQRWKWVLPPTTTYQKGHMTDSGDMYHWGRIWTPPVAGEKWGRVEEDAFREVPCGFSRHLLSPLSYPTPTLYAPIVPLPAGHWRGRLAHCRAQPANGRHAVALRDWSGSGLGGAHPSIHPQGG